jgi:hypothetical protein
MTVRKREKRKGRHTRRLASIYASDGCLYLDGNNWFVVVKAA